MMNFYTRPNFEDRQQVQYSGTVITLSGDTFVNNTGKLQINGPLLDFTGSTSASTQYFIAGQYGYINYGEPSSFIVEPPIILSSGTTGTTTVDVTGYILGGLDAEGRVTWYPSTYFLTGGTSGGTDNYVTGGTYSSGVLTLNRQNGSVVITGFFTGDTSGGTTVIQFTGNTSANCITDLWVSNVYGCDSGVTGNILHIQPNSNGDTFINENGGQTGVGIIPPGHVPYPVAILEVFGDPIGVYPTFRIVNSFGFTYLDVDDFGSFVWDNGSVLTLRSGTTLTLESGSTLNIQTGSANGYVLTSDASGNATWQPAPSGSGTTVIQFTGNTSANCITDLWVENINGCTTGVTIQNHTVFNTQNTYGPIRPNYFTEVLTSGNTTGGTYNISIPAGWVIEMVSVYTKTTDSTLDGVSMDTVGGVWSSVVIQLLGGTSNISPLIGFVGGGFNNPNYFISSDTLTIYFSVGGIPTALTEGEYVIGIRYWDGSEIY